MKSGYSRAHRRYAEAMIDALAFVPMKTLPGWPEAHYSSVHLLMLCVVWPIATAAVSYTHLTLPTSDLV